jgi:hypothetical protein
MSLRLRLLVSAVALVSVTQTTGCMHGGPKGRTVAYVGNALVAAAGTMLIVHEQTAEPENAFEVINELAIGTPLHTEIGIGLIAIAAVGVIGTAVMSKDYDREHAPTESEVRVDAALADMSIASARANEPAPEPTTPKPVLTPY